MSAQCRLYLLPSDIVRLFEDLRSGVDLKLISRTSTTPSPINLTSPLMEYTRRPTRKKNYHVNCYLAPKANAVIEMDYLSKQARWIVSESSDVIEFSGCDYDGERLEVGRFYFQSDKILDGTIRPKRPEFVQWANYVFRATKRSLCRSKRLDAYVGKDAADWERAGGHLENI